MTADTETQQANETLVRRLVDAVWNDGDHGQLDDLCATDVTIHDPVTPTTIHGTEGYERYVSRYRRGFSDLTVTAETFDTTDELVAVRTTGRGTHDGGFRGREPMGEESTLAGLQVFRVEDGTITEWSGTLVGESELSSFRESFGGRVVGPGDEDYDEVRAVWNGMIDRYPALVARCTGVADVIAAVDFARENDLLVAVRGGGHNVAGTAVCDGGLVVDCSPMTGIRVDLDTQTVHAQAGVTWGELDRETQAFGLATPGGVVSTTGIAGLTLGGGLGWLRHKHGLTIDNLRSVDVVTAAGEFLTASETENRELFWGIRGGGGNFGVVTSFEYRLHPVGPEVMFAGAMYPLETARDILPTWREYMADAPEEASAEAAFWTVPEVPDFPEETHGEPVVALLAVHCGSVETGRRVLQPLREFDEPLVDLSAPTPYVQVQQMFDPFLPEGELNYYWKSIELDSLDDEVVDAVVTAAENRPSPRTIMPIWHLGGAMGRVGPTETAYGDRSATYLLSIDSTWDDPADTEENVAWTREVWADMHRFSDGSLYLNFPGFNEEGEELVRAATGEDNHERLVALKDKYDPTNRFRTNQNVTPTV
ncbi:FAD-binding protein [Haladaptatus sp. NG-WS-4]